MDRFFFERLPVHQATGIWPVLRIFFNDFPLEYAGKYLVKGEVVSLSLLICMISDSNAVSSDGLDDVSHFHDLMASRRYGGPAVFPRQ